MASDARKRATTKMRGRKKYVNGEINVTTDLYVVRAMMLEKLIDDCYDFVNEAVSWSSEDVGSKRRKMMALINNEINCTRALGELFQKQSAIEAVAPSTEQQKVAEVNINEEKIINFQDEVEKAKQRVKECK